ncbi:NlpC/P60 family protein [Virgibacillus kekensis]|uniref:NlpC/P60 family protein n=1 Tax=Virgibacillus kekensis TaxID=202261 RepID=A0ABV9DG10_9BACI
MLNGTVEHVVKQSILYSYVLSQPFAVYVDAYPVLQNNQLLEAEKLQYGQHSKAVRVLQFKLNELSYYNDDIDGDFGILTEHALKKFQVDHNIKVTGQAGKLTLLAIIDEEKEKYMNQITEMSDSIYPGMHGKDVKIVQRALHYFGYYDGEIDGIYGPLTQKALEVAEEKHGIELVEEVSPSSLTTLYNKEDKTAETEQKTVKESEETTAPNEKVEVTSPNYSNVIDTAYSLIGTPYVWGGEAPGGFDCSGFIQYIFKTQGKVTPRTVSDTWNFTAPAGSPSVGELVFFETYKPGPSHMGIYVGDGKFIHAGASRGVEVSNLSNPYWDQRYLGSRRVQ